MRAPFYASLLLALTLSACAKKATHELEHDEPAEPTQSAQSTPAETPPATQETQEKAPSTGELERSREGEVIAYDDLEPPEEAPQDTTGGVEGGAVGSGPSIAHDFQPGLVADPTPEPDPAPAIDYSSRTELDFQAIDEMLSAPAPAVAAPEGGEYFEDDAEYEMEESYDFYQDSDGDDYGGADEISYDLQDAERRDRRVGSGDSLDVGSSASVSSPSRRSGALVGGRANNRNAGATRSSSASTPKTTTAPAGGAPSSGTIAIESAAPPPAPPADSRGYTPYVEGPSTEEYTDYGLNAMTLAAEDGFSTFSIDVDTASYTIARKKLIENQLPPTSSVRVEEFVNYFDYDYVGPDGEAPFAVNMEAAPHPYQSSHHVLRVGVQGREVEDSARKPVHLVFLVDVSGSMSAPDKLPLVKKSLRHLVDQLGPEDTVALATYAGNTRKVLDPTVATQRSVIHAAIDDLNASGSTAMSSGIEIAYSMASESMVYGAENRVIVCSDGDANVGGTSHEQILRTIQHYAEEGITLSTIGFGMGNYKDTMMEQLANKGDGNYYYIDGINEAEKVFGEDLSGTLQVIAKDVKIQVEFNPEAVYAYRLIGYENRDIADRDFRNDRVDAGEVGAGHSVTALYDVVLKDDWRDHEIATVRLRNKRPGPDSPAVEWSTTFPASMVHAEFADASADYRLAFGAATFAELLRGSHYTAEVTYAQVWNMVDDAKRRGQTQDTELLDLIRRAGDLSGEQIAWR